MDKKTDLENRVTAIETLLKAFKLERILYVVISSIAVGILITVAVFILFNNPDKIEWFISLFVPAGAITFSIGRILKMWNQALEFVNNQKISSDEKSK